MVPSGYEPPRNVSPGDAEEMVASGSVRPLDVRTPGEHRDLGHIAGSILLPVDLIAAAPATLARDAPPLLVYCEHGVRSAHASHLLARAGFAGVMNMRGGMSCWRGPRDFTPGDPFGPAGPSSWLVGNADLLPPRGGAALDLACGRGRHALLLASAGLSVTALDRDAEKIAALRGDADRLGFDLTAETVDLETGTPDLGEGRYDLVLVIRYLHRPLFPAIRAALKPGGILLYETFTIHQAARGHPRNPDFLLQPGELDHLVAPLRIERQREGDHDGGLVAGVAARKAPE